MYNLKDINTITYDVHNIYEGPVESSKFISQDELVKPLVGLALDVGNACYRCFMIHSYHFYKSSVFDTSDYIRHFETKIDLFRKYCCYVDQLLTQGLDEIDTPEFGYVNQLKVYVTKEYLEVYSDFAIQAPVPKSLKFNY